MRLLLLIGTLASAACSGGGGGDPAPGQGSGPTLEANAVDFGVVVVGTTATTALVLTNRATATIQVLGLSAPVAPFGFAAGRPATPFALLPGQSRQIMLTYAPGAETNSSFDLVVLHDAGAQVSIPVSGTGLTAESLTDFGLVPIDQGTEETADLEIAVPGDAVSFTIEAYGGTPTDPTGGPLFLAELRGPGSAVYVDPANPHASPYVFERNWPAAGLFNPNTLPWVPVDHARFQVPNSDRAAVQLVPGGGRYTFRLSNQGGTLRDVRVRVIVERRTGGNVNEGRIPLNVFFAAGVPVTTLSAPTDGRVQGVLAQADLTFRQTGAGLGAVAYFKLTDPRFDVIDPNELDALFRESSRAAQTRVNVFFVNASSAGFSGQAGAIPGGKSNGGPYSGVYVAYDPALSTGDLGLVVAHEIGHFLGLGHTREIPGTVPYANDQIDDTANCPGPGCTFPPGNNYLMDAFAPVSGNTIITPGQARVLLRNVLVEPGPPTFAILTQARGVSGLLAAPHAWCGNCAGK